MINFKPTKILSVLICLILGNQSIYSQNINCDSIYLINQKLIEKNVSIMRYDSLPILKDSLDYIEIILNENKYFPNSSNEVRVYLSLVVTKKGTPQCIKVVKGINKKLNRLAIGSVREKQFYPAKQNSISQDAVVLIPVIFRIKSVTGDNNCK